MTDRPADVTEWASSGSTTAPSSTRTANGWVGGDVPPAEQVNYLYNLWSSWLVYLAGAGRHTALGDAATELDVGETAIVDEYDGNSRPGSSIANGASGVSSQPIFMLSTGRYLIVAQTATIGTILVAYNRDDITASPTTISTSYAIAAITALASNGDQLVVAAGDEIEAFTVGTWASLWTYDHGAQVADVAIDGTRVYLGGASGTGSRRVRAIGISDGVADWSIDHGADVTHVEVTQGRCIIAGAPSSYASNSNLRAIDKETGNDATGECAGASTDTTGLAWNRLISNDVTAMATDGLRLYVGYDSTIAPATVEARDLHRGALLHSVQLNSTAYVYSLDADHELLVVGTHEDPSGTPDTGYVWALRKGDLAEAWQFRNFDSTHKAVWSVACDGTGVFACLDHSGSPVQRLARGNRPTLFRRVAATDDGRGYGRLIIAQEG